MTTDRSDVNYDRMQENLEILRRSRLKNGRDMRVVELPLPDEKLFLEDGTRLPPTYANFYIANGAVLVPQYGDRNDAAALDVLRCIPAHHHGWWKLSLSDAAAAAQLIQERINS